MCDGPALSHGPYLGTVSVCSFSSIILLSIKACVFSMNSQIEAEASLSSVSRQRLHLKKSWGMPVLFLSSVVFALGHTVLAYRTSRRARTKLLFHRIDPEAKGGNEARQKTVERVQTSSTPFNVTIEGVALLNVCLSREVVPAFARILLHTSLRKKNMIREFANAIENDALHKAQTVILVDASEENNTLANNGESARSSGQDSKMKGMILPFQPFAMTFHNVNYFVDMPKEMKGQGITEKKLQLLSSMSGVFSPGVLTSLVGSSGAGKATLMDVLIERKPGGYIEGEIKIFGFPKDHQTFARISGYVEQNDIHSPQVTVEESLWFSSASKRSHQREETGIC